MGDECLLRVVPPRHSLVTITADRLRIRDLLKQWSEHLTPSKLGACGGSYMCDEEREW